MKKYFDKKITEDNNLNDEALKSNIKRHSFRSAKDQNFFKSLLWEIEFEYKMSLGQPDTLNEGLKQWNSYHIEHIYPKSDNDKWKKYYNIKPNDEQAADAHVTLFESRFDAGNTTLWHKVPNIEEGTKPFSSKLNEYMKKDKVIHNLINECKISDKDDGWTKKSINDLSAKYADLVVSVLEKLS